MSGLLNLCDLFAAVKDIGFWPIKPRAELESRTPEDGASDGSKGDGQGGGDQMSSEAIAMAYLMRGVHF